LATASIAITTFRSDSVFVFAGVSSRSALTACTVPDHVRKSFAVKSSPVTSFKYLLMSLESTRLGWPSSSTVLKQLVTGKVAALLDDLGQTAVVDIDRMLDAALPAKLKTKKRPDAHGRGGCGASSIRTIGSA
jgi:hypothetical protein